MLERNAVFHGKTACTGVAIGKIYYYDSTLPRVKFSEGVPETELARLNLAIERCGQQLSELYESAKEMVGADTADIFAAHLAISKDEGYRRKMVARIEQDKANAEYAVFAVSEEYAEMFEAMEDTYMRERGSDMRAVGGRIIQAMRGKESKALALTEPVILLAEDLTPGDTIRLDRKNILGFVTEKGGMNSHTAILARALGIPAIVGAKIPHGESHGKRACLDGFTGDLILEPDAYTLERMREKQNEWRGMKKERYANAESGMRYWANVGSLAEVQLAARFDIAGIGLFRTEFLYMGRDEAPSEEEQFICYRDAVQQMQGRPVVFRLADLGGDKTESYLNIHPEVNPAMGMRGVRYLLSHPKYLKTQLRALCRASAYGNLRIMVPMVTSQEEMAAVCDLVQRVRHELTAEQKAVNDYIMIGAMIETPAAALCAASLCKYADFFSLGTNDLVQYTLAADRQTVFSKEPENMAVTAAWELALSNPRHPAVCKLIEMAASAAHHANIPICVCGEMATDLQMVEFFKQAGVYALSVSVGVLENLS